jgi:uncharacterized protein YcbX
MMPARMPAAIRQILRYPVKGLSAEPLARVALAPGEGVPGDRRFALHVGNQPFDPEAPAWQPKTNFLTLMRHERLARLATTFDEASGVLTIARDGRTVARGDLGQPSGRTVIEEFFGAFMAGAATRMPRLVEAPGHMFSDSPAKSVSLIGLASLKDLERVTRARVDLLRFRANFVVDGLAPWEEFAWVGREIALGSARGRVTARIDRCAATSVNPRTAERDLNVPLALQDGFRHADCGVYVAITEPGEAAVGDAAAPA